MQEARIRRAWGLDGEAPRVRQPERAEPQATPRPAEQRFAPNAHKRRFVQDGEVPVTLVHGLTGARRDHHDATPARVAVPTNRLEVAESALAAEISSREKAERALAEANVLVQQLQTKLGHADLARRDAIAALQRESATIIDLRAALANAEARAATTDAAHVAADTAPATTQDEPAPSIDAPVEPRAPARRGRKPKARLAAAVPNGDQAEAPAPDGSDASLQEERPVRWWVKPKRGAKAR